MLAATFKITGPARGSYAGEDTLEFKGKIITTRSREALSTHPSPSVGPVFCTLTDGCPVWVRPINLSNPEA